MGARPVRPLPTDRGERPRRPDRGNPYVESFGFPAGDELLAVELFSCLAEGQVVIEEWREDYNHRWLHSALGELTPNPFGAGCRVYVETPANTSLR
jgi:transposase InsO family protein